MNAYVVSIALSPQVASGASASAVHQLVSTNLAALDAEVRNRGVTRIRIPYPQVADPLSAGLRIGRDLVRLDAIQNATHIIVDISALPVGMYFAVVGALLLAHDEKRLSAELQIVVCENPDLDAAIITEGIGPASAIPGFRHSLDVESEAKPVRVWAPVLGKGSSHTLEAIYARIHPQEICPVLPFPAGRPRRADDIFGDLREILVDALAVEPTNLIYASEANPFDLYLSLVRMNDRYTAALKSLGAAVVVLSVHASKLLSLGVLLAAYERHLPVVNAPSLSYGVDPRLLLGQFGQPSHLTGLWIAGSPYED